MAMNALTPLAVPAKASFRACRGTVRGGEKSSDSACLGREEQKARRELPKTRMRCHAEFVSQAETKAHDPIWDAPRLNPAFVTQLLGQVMRQEQNRLVRAAYGCARERSARLVDTRF